MNIPTKITLARIAIILGLLVAFFVLSFIPNLTVGTIANTGINIVYFVAFLVFAIAASTDYLDGYLARKWHQVTNLGKFLDPVADKLLVDTMLIFLLVPQSYASGQIALPLWCAIVMIARDLVVDALRMIAVERGKVIAANIFGKAKTVMQMILVPMFLLNDWPFSLFDASWGTWRICLVFAYLTTIVSLLSGVIYIVQNRAVLKEEANG
jgi:CDP-diacylglycerol---glycerol-3-phosphate 3-phosphatidyltransferase